MENLFDFEGGSLDYRRLIPQTDLRDELFTSLTSFCLLHAQRRDHLQRAAQSFTLTAAGPHEGDPESKTVRVVVAVFGGAIGAACGLVSGGIWGFLGAVSAATFTRICGRINAVGATVGFFGSMLGGVVGGVFCGAVGGAVGAATGGGDSPAHGVVSDVAWFTIGCATGGAIGGIFGGMVGAAGGAVGGAFGGFCATRFSVCLVGSIYGRFSGSRDSKGQRMKSKTGTVQRAAEDFTETINPLVKEMKTIKSLSNGMADSDGVRSVVTEIEKTLVAVTTMEITLRDSQRAADLTQFVSRVEEAARQSQKVTEGIEKTREEVEKVLFSLRNPENRQRTET
uniref:keratin, type I cytoskeletal 13-like n=1 Tax=Semicossyphus pulcher TaxID=241346 RepID=UPI0037E8D19C